MASSEDLYRNPFSDYSANVMEAETIVDYWCSPFSVFENFAGLSEKDIYCEGNPLVFIGGRGSGKTMFLRYWSYEVQKQLYHSQEEKGEGLSNYINRNGGVGIYLRIDGPVLRSFEGNGLGEDKWMAIFIQYFELITSRSYIKLVNDLIESGDIENQKEIDNFLKKLARLLGHKSSIANLFQLIEIIDDRLQEITDYRGEIAFVDTDFKPSKAFASQSLSFSIPEVIKENFQGIDNKLNFLILIDEYENFLPSQQRMINTLLKFVKKGLTFRIGMRLEGFRTYATVTKDDFIKEGRDYQKIEFEDFLNHKVTGYQNYLKEIARKRLERVEIFKENDQLDITKFLGQKESLENEAFEIAQSNPKKLFEHKLFKSVLPKNAYEKLKSEGNPLSELLAILWVARGVKLDDASTAIRDYHSNKKSDLAKKFQYDLVNKYKLSLTILLNSIYRSKKGKGYYSFNTFSYLSSGIVGHFIELCRYSFRYAEFESKEKLFKGEIPKEVQTKAARDYSIKELQQIKRIEDYGNLLYQMVENLGNIFRQYHMDEFVRYPEMNQFSLDNKLEDKYKEAFKAALKWSLIQRKPNLQGSSPGEGRTELYTLSRVFSPEFQISYRTRGGINEEFDANDIRDLMEKSGFKPKRNLSKRAEFIIEESRQQKLDLGDSKGYE